LVLGDLERARQQLDQCFDDNLRAGNTYLVLTGLGQAATCVAQLEGLERARAELNAAIAFAEQRHLGGLPAFSAVLYHLAHVEYLADRLDEARVAAERAATLGRSGNFPEGYANGLMLQARVAVARGELAAAEALLTEAAALERNSNVVLLDTTIAVEQARLALAREQCGAGPPVAPLEASLERGWTSQAEAAVVLALRQALRAKDHERAGQLAGGLEREAAARGRGVALAIALLAQALLPERPDRWELLDRGLRLAAVRGYIRPLIDAGDVVRGLFQAALTHPLSAEARAHARLLLERLDAGAARVQAAAPRTTLLEPLTSREEEVLGYLFREYSNKAMARAMFVSAETVKTHLKHLYWKLGASDRDAAVARARELGLAPITPHQS
jgi:LuxR family maltose regulon positive regulatory protein